MDDHEQQLHVRQTDNYEHYNDHYGGSGVGWLRLVSRSNIFEITWKKIVICFIDWGFKKSFHLFLFPSFLKSDSHNTVDTFMSQTCCDMHNIIICARDINTNETC